MPLRQPHVTIDHIITWCRHEVEKAESLYSVPRDLGHGPADHHLWCRDLAHLLAHDVIRLLDKYAIALQHLTPDAEQERREIGYLLVRIQAAQNAIRKDLTVK
jgi:hypothetical protein